MFAQLQKKIYKHLEPSQMQNKELSIPNIVIILLIFISVSMQVVKTDQDFYYRNLSIISNLDLFIIFIFVIEYILRLWSYQLGKRYNKNKKYLYPLSNYSLIDLITLSILIYSFFSYSFVIHILCVTKIFSIFKYPKINNSIRLITRAIYKRRYEFFVTTTIFLLLMLFSAMILFFVEKDAQPKNFGSVPKSLWWAVVTLTTIGYGDVYPITILGKIFAVITMLMGVGVFAMPTGILASSFSHAFQETFENNVIKRLKEENKVLKKMYQDLSVIEKGINNIEEDLSHKNE